MKYYKIKIVNTFICKIDYYNNKIHYLYREIDDNKYEFFDTHGILPSHNVYTIIETYNSLEELIDKLPELLLI